ncbi:hypothetical protein [Embleya sp. NPDC020886]|uniref:hypothetical protein n=1 Tax=Embleya sp. NPDC020886 TaxID=3363980 RepID=UPI003797CE40
MSTAAVTAVTIAPMRPEHAGQVLTIHQLGIDTGNATFRERAPGWAELDAGKLPGHRFAALDESTGAAPGRDARRGAGRSGKRGRRIPALVCLDLLGTR